MRIRNRLGHLVIFFLELMALIPMLIIGALMGMGYLALKPLEWFFINVLKLIDEDYEKTYYEPRGKWVKNNMKMKVFELKEDD